MKNDWIKIAGFGLVIALALGALMLPVGTLAQNGPKAGTNGNSSAQLTRDKISDDFSRAIELIRENYIDPREHEQLTKTAIKGLLHSLDPHSDYMDAKDFREFNDKQHSRYFGIGSYISTRLGSTYVTEPFNGSPAVRAGLRYGDQIVNVDGTDTSKWSSDRVRELLLGERGTQVRVTIKRAGVAEPITSTIIRDQIALLSIPSYYMVKPGVGYIGLTRNFQSTTITELTYAIANLREKGATQFILDLRGNGGGYLDQGIKVADRLLQRGQTIVSVRARNRSNEQSAEAENGSSDNFPLIVLINGSSASASEIVAGAVQDHDRGLIVGETSFGKGLVQRIFQTSNGGGLILTIAHYYTPSGRLIQRDYSNGSLFEYYNRRSANGATDASKKGEMKTTDLGRQVYGGGGIEPDVKVEGIEAMTPAQARMWQGSWLFVAELINGQIPGSTQHKIAGINFDTPLRSTDHLVSDETLKSWATYMTKFSQDHPEFGIRPQDIEENKIWARKYIRQEVLNAAYGTDRAQQVLADLDPQLQRALQELPNAAALAERARARSNAMNRK